MSQSRWTNGTTCWELLRAELAQRDIETASTSITSLSICWYACRHLTVLLFVLVAGSGSSEVWTRLVEFSTSRSCIVAAALVVSTHIIPDCALEQVEGREESRPGPRQPQLKTEVYLTARRQT